MARFQQRLLAGFPSLEFCTEQVRLETEVVQLSGAIVSHDERMIAFVDIGNADSPPEFGGKQTPYLSGMMNLYSVDGKSVLQETDTWDTTEAEEAGTIDDLVERIANWAVELMQPALQGHGLLA